MKPRVLPFLTFLVGAVCFSPARADTAAGPARDIAYGAPADPLQTLDVYAPPNAKNLPVVVWIHGGGWQAGDKAEMLQKPPAFMDKGFVFVSVNYRLLPKVVMGDIVRDVAKSVRWVHDHISTYGGDPARLFIMGHSAGAQLAALLCTDERYLADEGLSFAMLKGCVPVDGDTYDVPAIIATDQTRRRVHGLPLPKFGHPEKFGTEEQQKDFSAVNHVAKDKGIPPFLLLYVADHPDTSAQALHFGAVLKGAGIPATLFGAKDTNHTKLNDNLGVAGDPATDALFEFVNGALQR
jgi:arylformamidase